MASLPATPDLSSHVDPISGKPSEMKKNPEARFLPSQMNPTQSAQHHSRRSTLSQEFQPSHAFDDPRSPDVRSLASTEQDVPGAFPTERMLARQNAEHAEAAPPPSTLDEIKHAAEVLGDYAKMYLPSSVGAYIGSKEEDLSEGESTEIDRETEYPSTEVPSGSRVGVGSLPGKATEPAVAALPEEKASLRFNAMTVPDSGPMSRARRAPFPPSDQVPRGGVGSLPGTPDESDVARLPEERKHLPEISSVDSHAPSSAAPRKQVSQEFPLPQRPSKSTNPFRNGQFGTISAGPTKPTYAEREVTDPEEVVAITPSPPCGDSNVPGLKEPHATPAQRRTLTPGGHGISREPSMAIGRQVVSGEELETLLEKEGITPRSMLREPGPYYFIEKFSVISRLIMNLILESNAVSEGSSAGMSPVPPDIPSPYQTKFVTQDDIPSSARGVRATEVFESPANRHGGVERGNPTSREAVRPFEEGSDSSPSSAAFRPASGAGAAIPIVPAIVQQSGGQNRSQVPPTGYPVTQSSMTPSPSKTPVSEASDPSTRSQERESPRKTKGRGKSEKAKYGKEREESEEGKEKSKSWLPKLSDWFRGRKSKSPSKRGRARGSRETSEELEGSPERAVGKGVDQAVEDRSALAEDRAGLTQQRVLGEEELKERNLAFHVMSIALQRLHSREDVLSPQQPSIVNEPLSATTKAPPGKSPSPAFVGADTLPQQPVHPSRAAAEAPSSGGVGIYRPPHRRSHSHPGSHSPVIPKHVPAHFDETIGPLPEHVEQRSGKELPSREKPGGSRVGVGSLPGDEEEEGVTLAPEERLVPSAMVKSASIPHTPLPEGLANQSRMPVDVPSASNVALGMYGGQSSQADRSVEERPLPPAPVVPQQPPQQLPSVSRGVETQPAGIAYFPAQQPSVAGYPTQTTVPAQYRQERDRLGSDDEHRSRLTEKEVQTENPRLQGKQLQTEGVQTAPVFSYPAQGPTTRVGRAPETVRSPSSGFLSLEHARQEEQERQREIESGQRKTIFTAGERQRDHVGFVPGLPSQREDLVGRSQAGPSVTYRRRSPPPTDMSTSFDNTSSTQRGIPTTTFSRHEDSASPSMPEQRSVPLGMEPGIADSTVVGQAPPPSPPHPHSGDLSVRVMPEKRSVPLGMEPGIAESKPASTSLPPAQYTYEQRDIGTGPSRATGTRGRPEVQRREPHRKTPPHQPSKNADERGFMSGLAHGAEEAVYDAGDTLRKHVPESVGEHLPHHDQPQSVVKPQEPSSSTPSRGVPRPPDEPSLATQRQAQRTTSSQPVPVHPVHKVTTESGVVPPGAQIRAQQRDVQRDIDNLKDRQSQGVLLTTSSAIQSSGIATTQARHPVSLVLHGSTPLGTPPHPSRSSSAEDVRIEDVRSEDDKPPRAPFSTHEQISGRPSDVIPEIQEEYVRSIVYEPGEMVATGGTLPGYPGPAALSALIGERIYDEHMRAAGAGEPIQTTTDTLQRQVPTIEPEVPHAKASVTARAADDEQPDFASAPPSSQPQSTLEPRPTNLTELLVSHERVPRTVSNISTATQRGSTSELGSPLTSAPVRGVDLTGGVGVSSLSGQPATSPTRLRSTLREEVLPRGQQAAHSERELKSTQTRIPRLAAGPSTARGSSGKGFGVDDLGPARGTEKKV
ncbi:hypothetical protein NP233_g10622 [Leucocoprinus birnbaumii]|uniref:Uncharacterized protein n=1 Tax=Leucocoprinus birnbaumii TaxID=56174 RepID=A0AAD5VKD3_9AGAR|nr:hypothetical protein NP233_g10622 [Leucocoprinus birnbaumii]